MLFCWAVSSNVVVELSPAVSSEAGWFASRGESGDEDRLDLNG